LAKNFAASLDQHAGHILFAQVVQHGRKAFALIDQRSHGSPIRKQMSALWQIS
jgi:hypothetical protein